MNIVGSHTLKNNVLPVSIHQRVHVSKETIKGYKISSRHTKIAAKNGKVGKQQKLFDNRVVVKDYYTNLIEVQNKAPGYVKLLKSFGIDSYEIEGKILSFDEFFCNNGHSYYYPNASVGEYNPFFLWSSIRRSACRSMRMLEKFKELNLVWDIVYTYPKEVSDLQLKEKDLDKRCHKCFRKMERWLSSTIGGKLAISENLHLWSSEKPLEPHLHHHTLMLDVYLVGDDAKDADKERMKIRTNLFMKWDKTTKKVVQTAYSMDVKREWASIVNEEFGTKYEMLDVNFEYRNIKKEPHRIVHKLKYNKRTPMPDLAEYFRKNQDAKTDGVSREYLTSLICYKNRTHCWGYWNRLSKLLSSIENFEEDKKSCRCVICGAESARKGTLTISELPKGIKLLEIDRKGRLNYRQWRGVY